MNYLIKNKKMVLGILGIIIISICYYIYSENSNFFNIEEQNLEVEKQETDTISTDEKNNDAINEIKEKNNIIIVHVSGAVNQEGIVELNENSRVSDAIKKAGGLKENACINEINLAYVLEDGTKIHIPTIEEQKENNNTKNTDNSNLYITNSSGTNLIKENNNEKKQSNKININTATQEELETLPGIGPSTALKIVNYRTQQGKFKSIEGLKDVSGIGESKFNNIKDMITI